MTDKPRTHKDTCVVAGPPGSGTRVTIFGGRIRTGTVIKPKSK